MARPTAHFTPELFKFLRQLKSHNDREWFTANKSRFERDVRDPFVLFIREIGPQLHKVSKHLVADPRPVGGSLFRIYRDTRFSKDKTPYKTHAAAHFRHEGTQKDVHGPGLYLHLEPGGCFFAGGMWRPEPAALRKIRDHIAAHPKDWQSVVRAGLTLEGESAKRVPPGFDAAHPWIEDIKRKDFIASVPLKDADVCSAAFVDTIGKGARTLAPLMKFLARAVRFDW